MRSVFVDTTYWLALLLKQDQYHQAARTFHASLPRDILLVTSEMVLTELLNGLAKYGRDIKQRADKFVRDLKSRPDTKIVQQTSELFERALLIYGKFDDKLWGLTDCASYELMKSGEIGEALTYDVHFEQMSFTVPPLRRDKF